MIPLLEVQLHDLVFIGCPLSILQRWPCYFEMEPGNERNCEGGRFAKWIIPNWSTLVSERSGSRQKTSTGPPFSNICWWYVSKLSSDMILTWLLLLYKFVLIILSLFINLGNNNTWQNCGTNGWAKWETSQSLAYLASELVCFGIPFSPYIVAGFCLIHVL
jgi:hypothetical protein